MSDNDEEPEVDYQALEISNPFEALSPCDNVVEVIEEGESQSILPQYDDAGRDTDDELPPLEEKHFKNLSKKGLKRLSSKSLATGKNNPRKT